MLDEQAIADAYERVRGPAPTFPARTWAGWKQIAQELGFTLDKAAQVICNYLLIVKVQVAYEFRSNNMEGLKALQEQASGLIMCLSHAHTASQSQAAGQEDEWLQHALQPQRGPAVASRLHRAVGEHQAIGLAGQEHQRNHGTTNPGSSHPRTESVREAPAGQRAGPGIGGNYQSRRVQTQPAAETSNTNPASAPATTSHINVQGVMGHSTQPFSAGGRFTAPGRARPHNQSMPAAGSMPPETARTASNTADHEVLNSGLINRLSTGLTGDAAQHIHRLPTSAPAPSSLPPPHILTSDPSVLFTKPQAALQHNAVPAIQQPAQNAGQQQPSALQPLEPVVQSAQQHVRVQTQPPQTQAAQPLHLPAMLQRVSDGAPTPARCAQEGNPSKAATASVQLQPEAQPAPPPAAVAPTAAPAATRTVNASKVDLQRNRPVAQTHNTEPELEPSRQPTQPLAVLPLSQARQFHSGAAGPHDTAAQPPQRAFPAKRPMHFGPDVEVIVIDDDDNEAMNANADLFANSSGEVPGRQVNTLGLLPMNKRPRTDGPTAVAGDKPVPAAPSAVQPPSSDLDIIPFRQRLAARKAQRQAAIAKDAAAAARAPPIDPALHTGMQAYMECRTACERMRAQAADSSLASAPLNAEPHTRPTVGTQTLRALANASVTAAAAHSVAAVAAAAATAETHAATLFAKFTAAVATSHNGSSRSNPEPQQTEPQRPLLNERSMPKALRQPLAPLGTLNRKDVLVPELPPAAGTGSEQEFMRSKVLPDADKYKSNTQPWPKYVVFSHFPVTQMRDLALRQHRRSGQLDVFHALSSHGLPVPARVDPADIVQPSSQLPVQGQQTQQPKQQVQPQKHHPNAGPSRVFVSSTPNSQAAATAQAPPVATAVARPVQQELARGNHAWERLRELAMHIGTNRLAVVERERAAAATVQPLPQPAVTKPTAASDMATKQAQNASGTAQPQEHGAGQKSSIAPSRIVCYPQATAAATALQQAAVPPQVTQAAAAATALQQAAVPPQVMQAAAAATAPPQAGVLPPGVQVAAAASSKQAAADVCAAVAAMPALGASALPPGIPSAPRQPQGAGDTAAPPIITTKPSRAEEHWLDRPAKKSRGLPPSVTSDADQDRPVEVQPAGLGLTGTGATGHGSASSAGVINLVPLSSVHSQQPPGSTAAPDAPVLGPDADAPPGHSQGQATSSGSSASRREDARAPPAPRFAGKSGDSRAYFAQLGRLACGRIEACVRAHAAAQPVQTLHTSLHQAAASAEQRRSPPPGPAAVPQQAHNPSSHDPSTHNPSTQRPVAHNTSTHNLSTDNTSTQHQYGHSQSTQQRSIHSQSVGHPAPAGWGRQARVLLTPRMSQAGAAYMQCPPPLPPARAASPLLQAVSRPEEELQAAMAQQSHQGHAAHITALGTAGASHATAQGTAALAQAFPGGQSCPPPATAHQEPCSPADNIRGIAHGGKSYPVPPTARQGLSGSVGHTRDTAQEQQREGSAAATAPGAARNAHPGVHATSEMQPMSAPATIVPLRSRMEAQPQERGAAADESGAAASNPHHGIQPLAITTDTTRTSGGVCTRAQAAEAAHAAADAAQVAAEAAAEALVLLGMR